jgi:hypothetical protein
MVLTIHLLCYQTYGFDLCIFTFVFVYVRCLWHSTSIEENALPKYKVWGGAKRKWMEANERVIF